VNARHRLAALLVVLFALGWGSALEVRVDDSGGPADLADRVDAAVAAWRAAGAPVDDVTRTVLVRYASPDLLGPDAISLVLTGGPPGVDLEVLLRADAGARLDDALVVAVGIALGGSPGVGVLDGRLTPGIGRTPAADDVVGLAARSGTPGDITGDGRAGFDDLLALARSWGQRGVNLPADLDGDGTVGADDLALLREHYAFDSLVGEPDDGSEAAPDPGEGSEDAPDEPRDGEAAADEADLDEADLDEAVVDEQGNGPATDPEDGADAEREPGSDAPDAEDPPAGEDR
jgi:hypothetical protein